MCLVYLGPLTLKTCLGPVFNVLVDVGPYISGSNEMSGGTYSRMRKGMYCVKHEAAKVYRDEWSVHLHRCVTVDGHVCISQRHFDDLE